MTKGLNTDTPWIVNEKAATCLNCKGNDKKHRNYAIQWWKSNKKFVPPDNKKIEFSLIIKVIKERKK